MEGGMIATTTNCRNQTDEAEVLRSSSASTIHPTIPHQHVVLREERKRKKQIQQSAQGLNNQADDTLTQTHTAKTSIRDTTEMAQVGAFPFTVMDEASLPPITEARTVLTTHNSTGGLVAVNAHVVVDEEETASMTPVGPVIEAMPMEESEPASETQLLKALVKSRKCRLMSALAVILVVGLIVAVVLLTQNSSKSLPSSATEAPAFDTNETKSPQSPSQAPTFDSETASNQFLAELMPLLSNESLAALNDTDSPQSQSLRWLLETSNFQDWPFHQQVQRYAMATIYYATGGDWSWSNYGGNWLTNETECLWFQGSRGDFCVTNGTALQSLNQSMNALNGTIPREIDLLTSLTMIDLSSNKLSGTLLSELGSLTALTVLLLSSNSYKGNVPSELGSLTALTELDLSYNDFTGTVLSELGSLTALTLLSLRGNSFNGSLPSALGSLTSLTYLDLSYNDCTGTVPSELSSLTALTHLELTSNSLQGTLPLELISFTELAYLELTNIDLTGTVPSELGSLTALTELHLSLNDLTGTVPSELGSLTTLTFLRISSNSFKGTVPSELGLLTALEIFWLNNNSFTGTVPSELGSLTALTRLYLYGNSFNNSTNTVPTQLCNHENAVIKVDCALVPLCSCCDCEIYRLPRPFNR